MPCRFQMIFWEFCLESSIWQTGKAEAWNSIFTLKNTLRESHQPQNRAIQCPSRCAESTSRLIPVGMSMCHKMATRVPAEVWGHCCSSPGLQVRKQNLKTGHSIYQPWNDGRLNHLFKRTVRKLPGHFWVVSESDPRFFSRKSFGRKPCW